MDGWFGFNSVLSTQVAAISYLKFISKANGMYKRALKSVKIQLSSNHQIDLSCSMNETHEAFGNNADGSTHNSCEISRNISCHS